jgi:very-short-patch-repair endonuclease
VSRDPFDDILAAALGGIEYELRARHDQLPAESPIERLFATAFYVSGKYVRKSIYSDVCFLYARVEPPLSEDRMHDLFIQPQVRIGEYRVDFLVHAYSFEADDINDEGYAYLAKRWRRVVVECDGHDFHERTKEQAAKDKSRDRALILAGYQVIRFTGSEIWRDPVACATQVLQLCEGHS